MPKPDHNAKLHELAALADDPRAQQGRAIELLGDRNDLVLQAALRVLAEQPAPSVRERLHEIYAYRDTNGIKRDPSGYVRAAIIRALQPIARADDLPLLEHAALTYEFLPPSRSESTAMIRAAALVAIDALDTMRAGYHAARLLFDPYTLMMSGEPALTAVRTLADQGQTLPLYAYAANVHALAPEHQRPEVVSECMRYLRRLPDALLPPLIEQIRAANNELMLVGLFDLLLEHASRDRWLPLIWEFIAETRSYSLHRYLVTAIAASRDQVMLDYLIGLAQDERDRTKRDNMRDAFALLRGDPAIEAALAAMDA